MAERILIVEDNVDTAENIRLYLEHSGYECCIQHSGSSALSAFLEYQYHLVILDFMLPDFDGKTLCEKIRAKSNIPIIMLTARVQEEDLCACLASGADDYIKKPYSNKELVSRVQAHLRRSIVNNFKQVGPYSYDDVSKTISVMGKALQLTITEFGLLKVLILSPGRLFTRERLMVETFNDEHDAFEQTINVHIHNLRKKIKAVGVKNHGITSIYGMGYKFELK